MDVTIQPSPRSRFVRWPAASSFSQQQDGWRIRDVAEGAVSIKPLQSQPRSTPYATSSSCLSGLAMHVSNAALPPLASAAYSPDSYISVMKYFLML